MHQPSCGKVRLLAAAPPADPTQTGAGMRPQVRSDPLPTDLPAAPRQPPSPPPPSKAAARATMLRSAQRLAGSLLVQAETACSSGAGWEGLQRAGISGTAAAARRLFPAAGPVRPEDGGWRMARTGGEGRPAAATAAARRPLPPPLPHPCLWPPSAAVSGVERPYLVDKVRGAGATRPDVPPAPGLLLPAALLPHAAPFAASGARGTNLHTAICLPFAVPGGGADGAGGAQQAVAAGGGPRV